MYVEYKGDGINGSARIGRVTFSDSGRTRYYDGWALRQCAGYKYNHYDIKTGEQFWISGCKKDGTDRNYSGIVEIDEDVRQEYWLTIRKRPQDVKKRSFRAVGKYSHRSPA